MAIRAVIEERPAAGIESDLERPDLWNPAHVYSVFSGMRYLPFLLATACIAAEPGPQALIESGHFKRARAIVAQSYRANPREPETLWLMSRLKEAWHDYDAAMDFAEKALGANPNNARYHLRVAEVAGALAQRANILKQFSLARRVKSEIDATLALDPNNTDALRILMNFYVTAPSVIGGDKAKAQSIPTRIMQVDPVKGIIAQLDLAELQKEKADTEVLLREAVRIRPGSYDARVRLAGYYCDAKRYVEAESQAREAIRLDPGRVDARSKLVAALVDEKKWAALDAALADSESGVPDDLSPYCVAAFKCVIGMIELPRAERYLRKYISQEPEAGGPSLVDAHRLLGGALHRQGRKKEAIAEYQIAVKLDPNSPAKEELKKISQ